AVGVAALMMQNNPSMTADQIEARMKATGVSVTDAANGRVTPRVDALAALTDTDNDGVPDLPDNCPATANAGQANADGNFVDLSPPYGFDDITWINSYAAG